MDLTTLLRRPVEEGSFGDGPTLFVADNPSPAVIQLASKAADVRPATMMGCVVSAPTLYNLSPLEAFGCRAGILWLRHPQQPGRVALVHLGTNQGFLLRAAGTGDDYRMTTSCWNNYESQGRGLSNLLGSVADRGGQTVAQHLLATEGAAQRSPEGDLLWWTATLLLTGYRSANEHTNLIKIEGQYYRSIHKKWLEAMAEPEVDFFKASGPVTHVVIGQLDNAPFVIPVKPITTTTYSVTKPDATRMDVLLRDDEVLLHKEWLAHEFNKLARYYGCVESIDANALIATYQGLTANIRDENVHAGHPLYKDMYQEIMAKAGRKLQSFVEKVCVPQAGKLWFKPANVQDIAAMRSPSEMLTWMTARERSLMLSERVGNTNLFAGFISGAPALIDAAWLMDMAEREPNAWVAVPLQQALLVPQVGEVIGVRATDGSDLTQADFLVMAVFEDRVVLKALNEMEPHLYVVPVTALRRKWWVDVPARNSLSLFLRKDTKEIIIHWRTRGTDVTHHWALSRLKGVTRDFDLNAGSGAEINVERFRELVDHCFQELIWGKAWTHCEWLAASCQHLRMLAVNTQWLNEEGGTSLDTTKDSAQIRVAPLGWHNPAANVRLAVGADKARADVLFIQPGPDNQVWTNPDRSRRWVIPEGVALLASSINSSCLGYHLSCWRQTTSANMDMAPFQWDTTVPLSTVQAWAKTMGVTVQAESKKGYLERQITLIRDTM